MRRRFSKVTLLVLALFLAPADFPSHASRPWSPLHFLAKRNEKPGLSVWAGLAWSGFGVVRLGWLWAWPGCWAGRVGWAGLGCAGLGGAGWPGCAMLCWAGPSVFYTASCTPVHWPSVFYAATYAQRVLRDFVPRLYWPSAHLLAQRAGPNQPSPAQPNLVEPRPRQPGPAQPGQP